MRIPRGMQERPLAVPMRDRPLNLAYGLHEGHKAHVVRITRRNNDLQRTEPPHYHVERVYRTLKPTGYHETVVQQRIEADRPSAEHWRGVYLTAREGHANAPRFVDEHASSLSLVRVRGCRNELTTRRRFDSRGRDRGEVLSCKGK